VRYEALRSVTVLFRAELLLLIQWPEPIRTEPTLRERGFAALWIVHPDQVQTDLSRIATSADADAHAPDHIDQILLGKGCVELGYGWMEHVIHTHDFLAYAHLVKFIGDPQKGQNL